MNGHRVAVATVYGFALSRELVEFLPFMLYGAVDGWLLRDFADEVRSARRRCRGGLCGLGRGGRGFRRPHRTMHVCGAKGDLARGKACGPA